MSVTVETIIEALKRHKNVLLYGPPGTGKSHLMKEVARRFSIAENSQGMSEVTMIDTDAERVPLVTNHASSNIATRWVTFHQGYSYEDFVLGLRPQANGTLFSLIPRPGVLLELAAEARSSAALLLIDEINRGNTSRIFGEFITLMEPSKRLNEAGEPSETTVEITLPYLSPGESVTVQTSEGEQSISRNFAMPAAVFTLASMNSVDKSIAPIDTALRRRFHMISLFPSSKDLRLAVGLDVSDELVLDSSDGVPTADGIARLAVAVLEKLNRGIGLYLGQDFMIGQWYLDGLQSRNAATAVSTLAEIWLYRIVPQLIELFHGRTDALIALLGIEARGQGSGIEVHEPQPEEAEAGAIAYVTVAIPEPSPDDITGYLRRFAANSLAVTASDQA